jgi:hypothetical protein
VYAQIYICKRVWVHIAKQERRCAGHTNVTSGAYRCMWIGVSSNHNITRIFVAFLVFCRTFTVINFYYCCCNCKLLLMSLMALLSLLLLLLTIAQALVAVSDCEVSAAIGLAAALEYLTAEILELAGNITRARRFVHVIKHFSLTFHAIQPCYTRYKYVCLYVCNCRHSSLVSFDIHMAMRNDQELREVFRLFEVRKP